MSHARMLLLALLLSPLALLASSPARSITFSDPLFSFETVTTLPPFQPVGVTWATDGRMFIWQKNGVVRVHESGALKPTPFIDLSAQVNTFGDRGFLGLALDPDFLANGYVYFLYVYEDSGDPNNPQPKKLRLTRVTEDPLNPSVALPGSEHIIFGDIPADSQTHNGGTLHFAPDGTLFFSNGDGAGGATTESDALQALQIYTWRGKILRINPDGSAPSPPQATNPFYDGTDSIQSKVWAYGMRNPFRFDLDPASGEIYGGDVGWNTHEEINRILPGANYGWPCWEGPYPQPGYQADFPAECAAVPAEAVTQAAYSYDHSVGSAPVASSFYSGTVYPPEYHGNFFFSDYTGGFIRRFVLAPDGSVAQNLEFATGLAGAIVHMETGPDGFLYTVDFVSGVVSRLRYAGPVARAAATPNAGYSPLEVSFSSLGSFDPLGGALDYAWNFGDSASSTDANPLHTYTSGSVQTFEGTLTVTSETAQTAQAAVEVTVGSLPPVATIDTPLPGASVLPGQEVTYSGGATDPDEGALPGTSLKWDVLLHHNDHVHGFTGATGPSGSFEAEYHGTGIYSYEIILTATDSSGLETRESLFVPVDADATPPDAPTNLAASPQTLSSIDLSWDAATDDAGIKEYRVERCAGVGCVNFEEVWTTPDTAHLDTGLLADTDYVYRVRAIDPTGNLGAYSGSVAVATGTLAPQGLRAAYSFDEGQGSVVGDASGNGNTGVMTGATWAPGRLGKALFFDNGPLDLVDIPDSDSLDLTTGMTVEVWVQPTTDLDVFHVVVSKGGVRYVLSSNTSNAQTPEVVARIGGSCCAVVQGPGKLPLNQWTHMATTYDGTALRLYLDGIEVDSQPASGLMQASTLPLRIGGNDFGSERFIGLIDELRIYDYARSPTQIQEDMLTAISDDPAFFATPPSRSNGAPSGELTFGTTQTELSLTTDEAATCRYDTTPGVDYAAMANVFTTTGGSAHSTTVTGLADDTAYTYYVRCEDALANANPDDFIIAFTVAADTQPPIRSGGTPIGELAFGTMQVDLGLATDEAATCRYDTTPGVAYAAMANAFTTTGGSAHSTTVTGLVDDTAYTYYVRCEDALANANPDDFAIAFNVAADDLPEVPGLSLLGLSMLALALSAITWLRLARQRSA